MKNKATILVSILIFAVTALVTSSCKNTANGAGKDIENMGEKIQEKTE